MLLVGLVYDEELEADRAEACMVVSYDRDAGTVKLASLVTDIWTAIEGFDEGHLDEAYADGGIDLLLSTVNADFGLNLDTYAVMNFDEFAACIDQLGGLTMDITAEEAEWISDLTDTDVAEGAALLSGEQALAHVRNRYIGGGDFDRVERQRELLATVYSTLARNGFRGGLPRVPALCAGQRHDQHERPRRSQARPGVPAERQPRHLLQPRAL